MTHTDADLAAFLEWCSAKSLRQLGRKPAPKTLVTKASRIRTACRHAGTNVRLFTSSTLAQRGPWEMLLANLYAEHSPGTVSNVVSTLRELATYAQLRGWADRSVIEPNDAPVRAPQAPHAIYAPAETATLIAAAVGVRGAGRRFSALLLVLSETGCRIGEALDLTWDAVRPDAEPPHAVLPSTKSRKPQYLALSTRVVEEVFAQEAQATFMGERGRFARDPSVYVFPWAYCSLRTMFGRLCRVCGVPNHGFHAFRHTKATAMLAGGVPIQAVAALLRHSSVAITDRYYNATNALQYAKYLEM